MAENEGKLSKGNKLISKLIDVKLFGGMVPEEARLIGSIQCEWARSLHDIEIESINVSSAFSSKETRKSGSFGTRYVIPYGLYGGSFIYSPTRNSSLKEACGEGINIEELEYFEEGLKYGSLHGRSGVKGFVEPLLIVKVIKDKSLNNRFDSLSDEIDIELLNESVRSKNDINISLTKFRRILEKHRGKEFKRIEVYSSDAGKRKFKDILNISKKYNELQVLEKDLDCSIEYVVIYEVKYSNPNGDPMFDNMPRRWEGTNLGIISPERQKRWIRDYLEDVKKELILISRTSKVQKAKDRLKEIEKLFE